MEVKSSPNLLHPASKSFHTRFGIASGPGALSGGAALLQGPNGNGPYVTVVGHAFDAFAEESAKMGPPKPVTNRFVNPYWHRYNEGLAKITAPEFSKGPVIAPGAGHFVQKDNPEFVVQELNELLEKVL